jgi:colicin import membrane protein
VSSTVSYIVSVILAVCFHAAVLGLLLMNWDDNELVNVLSEQRFYIEATVVDENPYKAKKRKEEAKQADKRRITRRDAAERKAHLDREAIEKAKRLDLEKQLAVEREKEEQDAISRAEADRRKIMDQESGQSETERLEMEESLALSIREEQDFRRAVTDDEKALAYVSQIQREIVENWSRPPSARNGMEVLLRVFLVPTGEVIDVVLEVSSGNDSFDRSAVLAVRKAERFQVPGQSRQFERNFREFTVLFRPEDLRL